jgi:hypothetical protein
MDVQDGPEYAHGAGGDRPSVANTLNYQLNAVISHNQDEVYVSVLHSLLHKTGWLRWE